jgi:hypothetical protein
MVLSVSVAFIEKIISYTSLYFKVLLKIRSHLISNAPGLVNLPDSRFLQPFGSLIEKHTRLIDPFRFRGQHKEAVTILIPGMPGCSERCGSGITRT